MIFLNTDIESFWDLWCTRQNDERPKCSQKSPQKSRVATRFLPGEGGVTCETPERPPDTYGGKGVLCGTTFRDVPEAKFIWGRRGLRDNFWEIYLNPGFSKLVCKPPPKHRIVSLCVNCEDRTLPQFLDWSVVNPMLQVRGKPKE